MNLKSFFQIDPLPADQLVGYYNPELVLLSYIMAVLASYVALHITNRIRTNPDPMLNNLRLAGGALAMGMGIWAMHFIGMMAFIMPLPLNYDLFHTGLSLVIAIVSSAFSFYIVQKRSADLRIFLVGGSLLGFGIACMHYVGMEGMQAVQIKYLPGLFTLSIVIAIATSVVALWLIIKSSLVQKHHNQIKLGSALIMGLGICGMHYIGMEAAVITSVQGSDITSASLLDPQSLAISTALMTIFIFILAAFANHISVNVLQSKNKEMFAAEAKIRAILSIVGNGLAVVDENGTIEMVNKAMEKAFGYDQEELISQNIGKLVKIFNKQKEDDEGSFDISSLDVQQFEKDVTKACIGLAKNGKRIPIEMTLSSTIIDNKELYVLLLCDISERKKSEEYISNLNLKLLTTSRFAGMAEASALMLHNIGNILNSLNLSTDILLQKCIHEKEKITELSEIAYVLIEHRKRDELAAFFKANQIGRNLPEYWLKFTEYWRDEHADILNELEGLRAKAENIEHVVNAQQLLFKNLNELEKVNVNQLIEDVLAINSQDIEQYNIIVERDFGKIPPLLVNKLKLMQTLVNILHNAVEALSVTSKDNKLLTLRTKQENESFLKIEIIDNGIGIKPENLTHIFDLGFTTKKSGSGLGLHSSSISVHEMGGTLKASSNGLHQGACFTLLFPCNNSLKK